jgi:hypothetical protein
MTEQKRCVLPLIHAQIITDGSINLCCNSLEFKKTVDVKSISFHNILNNENHKRIRAQMRNGDLPAECNLCWKTESLGVTSYRQNMNQLYGSYLDLYDSIDSDGSIQQPIKYLDVKLNNTCNLKCVMCSSRYSTAWIQEEQKLLSAVKNRKNQILLKSRVDEYQNKSFKWSSQIENINGIISISDSLERINFAGGEPLLAKSHLPLIRGLIENGNSKNIMLSYNTNGCYLTDELLDLWSKFKAVKVNISIDGIGDQLEYIRYPITWKELESSIMMLENCQHENIYSALLLTFAAYNAPYLVDIIDWKIKSNFKRVHIYKPGDEYLFYLSPLSFPDYLSAQVLPQEIKNKIICDLEAYEKTVDSVYLASFLKIKKSAIANMTSNNSNELFDQFIDYFESINDVRNLNFCKTFPIFKEFFQ